MHVSFSFEVSSPVSLSRQSSALNIYRLFTLFAVSVLAAAECKLASWDRHVFWVSMTTVVVSVGALSAYITQRPTTGPVWLELVISIVFSALWMVNGILGLYAYYNPEGIVGIMAASFLTLYSMVLTIAAIRLWWHEESPWTRPVHAMDKGHIMLVDEPDLVQTPVSV